MSKRVEGLSCLAPLTAVAQPGMADDAGNSSTTGAATQLADRTEQTPGLEIAPDSAVVGPLDSAVGPLEIGQGGNPAGKLEGPLEVGQGGKLEGPLDNGLYGRSNALATQRSKGVRWRPSRRSLGLGLAVVGICALFAIAVLDIARSASQRNAATATQANLQQASAIEAPRPVDESPPSVASGTEDVDAAGPIFDETGAEDDQPSTKPEVPKHFATVQDAAARSCTTASVEGLSRQIISEARCISPNALVPLPARPNLALDAQVLPYLDVEARNRLVKALDAHRDRTMTIHSALRTVAQQYLVWRWSANKRCGVPLATPPGDSNHESGLALDIAEHASWRSTLEAQGFKWLGASDKVHFDYKGTSNHRSVDVQAFQRLWNRNHADDPIATDGRYSPATELRLKKAPPDGFRIGSTCAKPKVTGRSSR